MRRFLSLLLVVLTVLSLVGCAEHKSAENSSTISNAESQPTGAQDDSATMPTEPEETQPAEAKTSGLVIGNYTLTETKGYVEIYLVSPDDGEIQQLFSVNLARRTDGTAFYLHGSARYASQRGLVSKDLSKIAITKLDINKNEWHAGWIDREGKFWDITEALGLVPESDFEKLPQHAACGFTEKDEFVFMDNNNDKVYRVPVDSLNPESMIEGQETPECIELLGWPDTGWERNNRMPTDIIDGTYFLADYFHVSGHYTESVIVDATTEEATSYVPGDARHSWSGTLSPDGKQVAFLSALRDTHDTPTDLYVTTLDGGEPRKVEVDLPDSLKDVGLVKTDLIGMGTYVFIVDWVEN